MSNAPCDAARLSVKVHPAEGSGTVRRFGIDRSTSWGELGTKLREFIPSGAVFRLEYTDGDGDQITCDSADEWAELATEAVGVVHARYTPPATLATPVVGVCGGGLGSAAPAVCPVARCAPIVPTLAAPRAVARAAPQPRDCPDAAAPAPPTRPETACQRDGCPFLAHTSQRHGHCCFKCTRSGDHGPSCEARPAPSPTLPTPEAPQPAAPEALPLPNPPAAGLPRSPVTAAIAEALAGIPGLRNLLVVPEDGGDVRVEADVPLAALGLGAVPQCVADLQQRALRFMDEGAYPLALSVWQQVQQAQGLHPTALYNKACCQALMGQAEAALASLRQAVDCGYDNINHMYNDVDLASLKGQPAFTELIATMGLLAEQARANASAAGDTLTNAVARAAAAAEESQAFKAATAAAASAQESAAFKEAMAAGATAAAAFEQAAEQAGNLVATAVNNAAESFAEARAAAEAPEADVAMAEDATPVVAVAAPVQAQLGDAVPAIRTNGPAEEQPERLRGAAVKLQTLLDMGFPYEAAKNALASTKGNVQQAVAQLLCPSATGMI